MRSYESFLLLSCTKGGTNYHSSGSLRRINAHCDVRANIMYHSSISSFETSSINFAARHNYNFVILFVRSFESHWYMWQVSMKIMSKLAIISIISFWKILWIGEGGGLIIHDSAFRFRLTLVLLMPATRNVKPIVFQMPHYHSGRSDRRRPQWFPMQLQQWPSNDALLILLRALWNGTHLLSKDLCMQLNGYKTIIIYVPDL